LAWVETGPSSASGGGVSNSSLTSRNPSLAINAGRLCVAWIETDGSSATTDVRCANDGPRPELIITIDLALNLTTVSAGDTVTGTVTYRNIGNAPQPLNDMVIASRPPGGTHVGGPYRDLVPTTGPMTIAAGESYKVVATRAFTGADPTGSWVAYATWQDAALVWHDGPELTYDIVP
jgi:uncharacterized repeat protein (TIGR01451 family)